MNIELSYFDIICLIILFLGIVWYFQFLFAILVGPDLIYENKITFDEWNKLQLIPFYFIILIKKLN